MKGYCISYRERSATPLYPTWFRWKRVLPAVGSRRISLYIPHGSDESSPIYCVFHNFPRFISHMVQMKGFMHRLKRKRILPLYPTWFRWKCGHQSLMLYLLQSLYPTWFRWKFSPPNAIKLSCNLYIPHGSDERRPVALFQHWIAVLYIPHGSDERLTALKKT